MSWALRNYQGKKGAIPKKFVAKSISTFINTGLLQLLLFVLVNIYFQLILWGGRVLHLFYSTRGGSCEIIFNFWEEECIFLWHLELDQLLSPNTFRSVRNCPLLLWQYIGYSLFYLIETTHTSDLAQPTRRGAVWLIVTCAPSLASRSPGCSLCHIKALTWTPSPPWLPALYTFEEGSLHTPLPNTFTLSFSQLLTFNPSTNSLF
jgi:hypothetical protein